MWDLRAEAWTLASQHCAVKNSVRALKKHVAPLLTPEKLCKQRFCELFQKFEVFAQGSHFSSIHHLYKQESPCMLSIANRKLHTLRSRLTQILVLPSSMVPLVSHMIRFLSCLGLLQLYQISCLVLIVLRICSLVNWINFSIYSVLLSLSFM